MSQATQAREEMDTVLECCICLTEYTKPKLLPCLHTFCVGCLKQYCDHLKRVKVPCPLCKKKFTVPKWGGVDSLRDNELVNSLILKNKLEIGRLASRKCDLCKSVGQEIEADSFCMECRECLCHRCQMIHANASCSKDHTVESIEEKPVKKKLRLMMSSSCSKHSDREIELYCCDCRMLICVLCHTTSHTKHWCKVIYEAVIEKKVHLENGRVNLEEVSIVKRECLDKLRESSVMFFLQASSTESAVKRNISNMKKLLDDFEHELLDKLANIKKARIKEMDIKNDSEEICYMTLNSLLSYSRTVLDRGTDCDIIRAADELQARADEFMKGQKEKDTEFIYQPELNFIESLTRSPEDIKKLVGDIVYEAVKGLHTSSLSTVQIIELDELVRGVTVVNGEIFVVQKTQLIDSETRMAVRVGSTIFVERETQSHVKVFDSRSLRASRDITIGPPGIEDTFSLAGCAHNKALYISDLLLKCIHRVDLTNNSVTRWELRENHEPLCLSVTAKHTLLVTVWISGTRRESGVVEYTSEGQLVRDIRFDRSIERAWHTVQLSSDQFIVSHGRYTLPHRVCLINTEGQIIKSYGGEEGDGGMLNGCYSLAFDEKNKHIFLADCKNHRVLMLDTDLNCLGQVHLQFNLIRPYPLHCDSSTDRLLICEAGGRRLFVVSPPD